jgi:RNA polymerase sigma-70 factor (ECF subfamily)
VKSVSANHSGNLPELVRRIIAGDAAAEEELVLRYKRGVSIVIAQIVNCPAAAEDASQDTFRIVIESIRNRGLRDPERLSGFVRAVARNTAIACVRRANRVRTDSLDDAEPVADPAPNQLDRILIQEKARVVRRVIGELPRERDREMLRRYFVAEQDKETICRDLNLSSAQFNNAISRAIGRFKKLYARRSKKGPK